ncbi:MAG TPA: immunoglobulin domain-containing protein [Candidatus Sulfotelmatobacter sp.]|nr:immunoglobulin domain-containing protein [Candidatus Sulfotelmatobacter sp.]
MKITAFLRRRYAWMNLSTVTLVALLQRSPAVRLATMAEEFVATSPVGALVRYASAALATLGAMNSIAGATILASSLTPNPTGPLPTFDATVGRPITTLGFAITNTMNVASWTITGQIPPGLKLQAYENPSIFLTGPGNLDATSPGMAGNPWDPAGTSGNNTTTPELVGTPTTPGTYTFMLQGFALPGEKGGAGVANFVGTGISSVFPFTIVVSDAVSAAPVFTTQPISVTVPGGTVALVAEASNSPTYQWMLNGTTPVASATSSILLISNAAAAVGSYTCVATNAVGSTTSKPATVAIDHTNDIGRLVNISCRATVGTGGDILIAGFVVGGSGTSGQESLLIRGSGPALVPFGVGGTLSDPQLQIFSGSTVEGTNNGWAGSAQIASAAAQVGAFAWTDASSHDSALLETLPAGAYTAQIAGQSGDTGVALAELYDATPAGSYTLASPRIVNISARVQVGTGGNILIAGFVIGGSTSRTVLIRASGPALVPFGVPGTLADPKLQLYSGSTVLESNSGWAGVSQISSTAASVGAFPWGSSTSTDSAILVTLPPGPYTAQVSGASGDTGVALVEVYEVP